MPSLTIAQCLAKASQLNMVSDSPRLDVELLLAHVLQQNRTYLFTWPEKELTPVQLQEFEMLFTRRLTGEPIAHLTGRREFWSLSLSVNNATLIPRPDTELLVETVLELFAQDAAQPVRYCLDLGTGTGAITLALASEKPDWKFVGVDVSIAAVELAEKNRAALVFDHVTLYQSNWFAQVPVQLFDVIVSNPPYIDPQDPHLHHGDVRFEPKSALVAERHGLADIQHIIAAAPNYLKGDGWLLLEHGYDQATKVRELMRIHGFAEVDTRCDYGGNERVTIGRKPAVKNDE